MGFVRSEDKDIDAILLENDNVSDDTPNRAARLDRMIGSFVMESLRGLVQRYRRAVSEEGQHRKPVSSCERLQSLMNMMVITVMITLLGIFTMLVRIFMTGLSTDLPKLLKSFPAFFKDLVIVFNEWWNDQCVMRWLFGVSCVQKGQTPFVGSKIVSVLQFTESSVDYSVGIVVFLFAVLFTFVYYLFGDILCNRLHSVLRTCPAVSDSTGNYGSRLLSLLISTTAFVVAVGQPLGTRYCSDYHCLDSFIRSAPVQEIILFRGESDVIPSKQLFKESVTTMTKPAYYDDYSNDTCAATWEMVIPSSTPTIQNETNEQTSAVYRFANECMFPLVSDGLWYLGGESDPLDAAILFSRGGYCSYRLLSGMDDQDENTWSSYWQSVNDNARYIQHARRVRNWWSATNKVASASSAAKSIWNALAQIPAVVKRIGLSLADLACRLSTVATPLIVEPVSACWYWIAYIMTSF